MSLTSSVPFPQLIPVRQNFDAQKCEDVTLAVTAELQRLGLDRQVSAGQSVAITAGSRGISNIAEIIKAISDYFISLGARPFIVPAMGSHGGGTAAGQQQVLATYGITAEYCGCPIRSSMDTVTISEAPEGFPIYFDKFAFEADHVVVCGRIKPHTSFAGTIQSGLMKMLMIGLGKKDGASLYHRVIADHGFPQIIRSVAPQVIQHAPILAGVAIVENAFDQTSHIEAVLPADFAQTEPRLLQMARERMPQLPFRDLDVLLIDRIGKNISGTGMDTNIIGRKHSEPADAQPSIQRIVVRGLTPQTHGNATGLGFAEFCLTRAVDAMNRDTTVLNCLTALDITAAKIPVHYDTDREVLQAALGTLGRRAAAGARLAWIRDTAHLSTLYCSEALATEIAAHPNLTELGPAQPLKFDHNGMLTDEAFQQ